MEPSTSTGFTGKRRIEGDEGAGDAKRQARERREPRTRLFGRIVRTRPENNTEKHASGALERVKLTANYIRLVRAPQWQISKYHATFEPDCPCARTRNFLIGQYKSVLGGYLFDGTQLFLARQIQTDNGVHKFQATLPRENITYEIRLQFTKVVEMTEDESYQVLNLILRRATAALKLELVNRNYFDPKAAVLDLERSFRLQLWPGYQTSIRKHETDILLNCDILFKSMRTDTVYDLMQETRREDPVRFRDNFLAKVLGITVLTGYNNSTYRIDDVDFDKTPRTTFPRKNDEISFVAYYKEKHQINIRDEHQPLLVVRPKEKDLRGGRDQLVLLIPELCRLTGLSERQRNDFNLKKEMKPWAQMAPHKRIESILNYNRRLSTTQDSQAVLKEWELGLEQRLVEVNGHLLQPETLVFGNDKRQQVVNASWDRDVGRGFNLYQPVTLKRWYVVYPGQMERDVKKFVARLRDLGRNMGFQIPNNPRDVIVRNDNEIVSKLDELIGQNPELIFCAVNSNNANTYAAIKKTCYYTHSVANQVVTRRILSREKGFDSVVTKVAIQMCTKLGGAPWLPAVIPMRGVMTIGFDVAKDSATKGRMYGCLVATMDLKQAANFYSAVSTYSDSETLSTQFGLNVVNALHAFDKQHGTLPSRIVIYRGGVGEGDITYVRDVEVKTIERQVQSAYDQRGMKLQMAFIVVTKKINTRIFAPRGNPGPGTVVDDVITLPERYEFFLVSQHVTQGTASPTNYNIIYDTVGLSADKIQIWTWKQSHIYYNWCGTTQVPSVLQYATKLAFMVSNFIHNAPNPALQERLYFL